MEGALLVSVGLPDITNNVVIDAVENVVKIIAGVGRLFGDDEPKHLPEAPPYPGTVAGVPPYPGMPPATPPPPPPGGGGGLDTGATGAGDQYNGSVEAAQLTDEKLAEMLKQIFAANQGARDKVSAILTEIQNKQKQIGPVIRHRWRRSASFWIKSSTRSRVARFVKFIMTEIFPGGRLPTVSMVETRARSAGFRVSRVQSLQPHYARTLDQWAAALEAHRDDAIAVQSQQVYDRYMKYLTGCADLFRGGYLDVNQFTLQK